LDIKTEIASRWGGVIEAYFDIDDEVWIIIEHCSDGVDRLVMPPRKVLDMSVVEKLQRIDQAAHVQGDEIHRKLEREDEQAEKDKDHEFSEKIGDGTERFYWAMMRDGISERKQIPMGPRKKAA
jgi:hypothetical protein